MRQKLRRARVKGEKEKKRGSTEQRYLILAF
jgi:hypothetical protein